MQKGNTKEKKNKGFTLIELIIVVAILAILVGILAPQYTKYVEKSRRAADMSNAKAIETTLKMALIDGEIQVKSLPSGKDNYNYCGVWVMICKGKEYSPSAYHDSHNNTKDKEDFDSYWCGADSDVIVSGKVVDKNNWAYCDGLETILKDAGISTDSLRTRSNGNRKNGWDWIIIQAGYDKTGQIYTKIYSGFKDQDGGINKTSGLTNIEKAMYGNEG